ncbi:hypothetical protein CK203_036993 [Vitis vinifera]|uniref:Uncharacterized protein n=1 Tax=Vitis vinifera TaxID=29760 RepID=A0A438IUT6_VITVI|nr:hypothetical protein CK203_036993 [Vitis vinifera]
MVSKCAPEMVGGSVMEALQERIARMEEILGEWPHEDDISYGEDIVVLKKVVLQGCSSGPKAPPKVRVPKPKGFIGNRNMKELENFLWDME